MPRIRFKEATTQDEFAQIHRLNHHIFAEELGQHQPNASGLLVDRFHNGNCYFVATERSEVIGMISLNCAPPFSISNRLQNPAVLSQFLRPAEVRLLAVGSGARNGLILAGLFWQLYAKALQLDRTHLLISGVSTRQQMYRELGFQDLGPAVPAGRASYIPMVLELGSACVRRKAGQFERWWARRVASQPVLLLPGPVEVAPAVREAFQRTPVSHRGSEAVLAYNEVRSRLSDLTGGMHVALLPGSGTLANDIVAACLRARFGNRPGLVLANGEFGERLVRHARGAGLTFTTLRWDWGSSWDHSRIEQELANGLGWVWGVHLETSTGVLNDLGQLTHQASRAGVVVAADCVSSLGAVAHDDLPLALASGVSGKALAAYAGLSLIMLNDEALRETAFERMPSCFNLAEAIRLNEPPFTIPSPQLFALKAALRTHYADGPAAQRRFDHYAGLGSMVREELRARGYSLLAAESCAAPTICTFPLPPGAADRCLRGGFCIAHESAYLHTRGWGQISNMGDLDADTLCPVFDLLGHNHSANDAIKPSVAGSASWCSSRDSEILFDTQPVS